MCYQVFDLAGAEPRRLLIKGSNHLRPIARPIAFILVFVTFVSASIPVARDERRRL